MRVVLVLQTIPSLSVVVRCRLLHVEAVEVLRER
jgi:hypothetical protein